MAPPDLIIRHAADDTTRAEVLGHALKQFGYAPALTTQTLPQGLPVLVLWSDTTMDDDALIWECAQTVRTAQAADAPVPIYEARITPGAAYVALFMSFGTLPANRLFRRSDLSEWSGEPDDDRLASLIWELPPPAAPSSAPPFARPASREDAEWRTLRANRDIGGMARWLQMRVPRNKDREHMVTHANKFADVRALGADSTTWAQFGPRTEAAAAAGPDSLRAWAEEIAKTCTMPDPDAPDSMRSISPVADLLFAIQICVGATAPHAFTRDLRTNDELIPLIEAGDTEAIRSIRWEYEFSVKLAPTFERLAKDGNAAAMQALSNLHTIPEYRRRVLKEKAAALGDTDALRELATALSHRGKHREAVALLRRRAELGDRGAKEELARTLDEGKHVKRDAKEVFALYQDGYSGGERRDPQTALRVAQMLWDGDGCTRDRERAVQMFFDLHIGEEAPYATTPIIGDLYRDGLGGVPKDRDEAIGWYKSARSYGEVEGEVARKRLKELGVKVERRYEKPDPETLREVRTFWRPRA